MAFFTTGNLGAICAAGLIAVQPSGTHRIRHHTASVQAAELEAAHWFALIYHDSLRRVLLLNGGPYRGGKSPAAPVELWSWDGARWQLVSADPAGPRWRNYAVAAYDAHRNRIVLYGGQQYDTQLGDTWEWDGRRWLRVDAPGPGVRGSATGAFDRARCVTLVFSGNRGAEVLGDAWAWDGRSWTQVPTAGPDAPSARGSVAAVFDENSGRTLMYGGHFPSPDQPRNFDELWSWDANGWRRLQNGSPSPGVRTNAAAVYDTAARAVILVGSGANDDVWQWRDGQWKSLGSGGFGPREGHGLAYDKARNRIVMFGGIAAPGGPQRDDTWEFDGSRWRCIARCR